MTNFDPEAQSELITEAEAKEISRQLSLSTSAHGHHNGLAQRKREPQLEKKVDASTISYLHTTYSQLHETQIQKLNDIFALNEGDKTKLKSIKRKTQTRIDTREKDMDIEDDENKSDDSIDKVSELAKDLKNLKFDKDRLKPIITFTPVHSEEEEIYDCRSSPFSDRPSSGSSSPLLEVPVCDFRNMSAEMMRPPLN